MVNAKRARAVTDERKQATKCSVRDGRRLSGREARRRLLFDPSDVGKRQMGSLASALAEKAQRVQYRNNVAHVRDWNEAAKRPKGASHGGGAQPSASLAEQTEVARLMIGLASQRVVFVFMR